jgi:hypothetical protein
MNAPTPDSDVPPSLGAQEPEIQSTSNRRRLSWLVRPVRFAGCRGPWQFIVRITLQKFVATVLGASPLAFLGANKHHPVVDTDFSVPNNVWRVLLAVIVIAPIFETLFLQTAPIEIARALRMPRIVQFLLGAIPFAALHFPMGIHMGLSAGTVGGFFLSHAYLECRNRSVGCALWITMVIHFVQNFLFMSWLLLVVWSGNQLAALEGM